MTRWRTSDDEVTLYVSPWISGTRARAYFGPISYETFLPDEGITDRETAWAKAQDEVLAGLRDKARNTGANAVVGLEVTADPFAVDSEGRVGLRLYAVGTAAHLEDLF